MGRIYKASNELTKKLLELPESGMGYQFVNDRQSSKSWLALNGEGLIDLSDLKIPPYLTKEFNSLPEVNFDPIFEAGRLNVAAKEAPIMKASGSEADRWIRLSAFENDIRIDRTTGGLLPGSFTTRVSDFMTMKMIIPGDTHPLMRIPHERYALPNNLPIEWLFTIQPSSGDEFQEGRTQPAFQRKGGGIECYFPGGTSENTVVSVSTY